MGNTRSESTAFFLTWLLAGVAAPKVKLLSLYWFSYIYINGLATAFGISALLFVDDVKMVFPLTAINLAIN